MLFVAKLVDAFIDAEGTDVAFVFTEGFSALRRLDGTWSTPAPDCTFGDFEEGWRSLSPVDAAALLSEARMATSESTVLAK